LEGVTGGAVVDALVVVDAVGVEVVVVVVVDDDDDVGADAAVDTTVEDDDNGVAFTVVPLESAEEGVACGGVEDDACGASTGGFSYFSGDCEFDGSGDCDSGDPGVGVAI
jgi:hypothetical protein